MGILDNIFGKKHSESENATARTVEEESQAIPTVMNYERSSLLKYVDKKMPVLIIGGKYNQKQVVLTSNPKYKSYTHNGHSWPCATIDMVTGEEPEPVRYIGTKPAKQEQSTEANQEDEKVKAEMKDISEAFNFNEIKDELPHFLNPNFSPPTFGTRYDEFCATLPAFNFYMEDEPQLPEDALSEIEWYRNVVSHGLVSGGNAERAKQYVKAAGLYQQLITSEYWEPEPYVRMMRLYKKSGQMDFYRELRNYTIRFFSERRKKMEQLLIRLAEQQNDRSLAEDAIKEKRKVSYYHGLFVIYDPFPIVETWQNEESADSI